MKALAPVDFKAVAAKGCFVYCYLRAKDSATAKAGTPYYIGLATRPTRPISHHHRGCPVPPVGSRHLIRVLRTGLSRDEACHWEKFYIKHYGRKDEGTGVLLNRTAGGDGATGLSPEGRERISQARKERGSTLSEEQIEALRLRMSEYRHSEESKTKIGLAHKGKIVSTETRRKLAEVAANRTEEHKQRIKRAHQINTAAKYEVDTEWYLSLAPAQKRKLCWRYCEGKRGADLVKGIAA